MNTRFLAVFALFGFLSVGASRLAAQNGDLPFSSGSTGADGALTLPAAADDSYGFGMAYDEKRQEVVRFGGVSSAGTNADTWVMRSSGWQKLTPVTSPPAAAFGAMAYDVMREEVVWFAGGQTWTWNGTTWTQKAPAHSPSSRTYAAMVWHSIAAEIVLFGGQTGSPGTILADTWTWNGTDWTQKSPATSPPARSAHAMAPYPPLGAVAMTCGNNMGFGQYNPNLNGNNFLQDLWLWDGTTWTQKIAQAFGGSGGWALTNYGVQSPSLVFDQVRNELLLFGGYFYYFNSNSVTHTYILNSSLKSWQHSRTPTVVAKASSPTGRWLAGAVWHTKKRRIVLACGRTSSAASNQPPTTQNSLTDSWYFTESVWYGATGPNYVIDLDSKPDPTWHFTTINIPIGTTVRFTRNPANTPVVWLASEGVTISGTLDVSGQSITTTGQDGVPARGGPGGYDGGLGSNGGSNAQAGEGPGSGAAGFSGDATGKNAAATTSYVSAFGIPLMGGSGGGGAFVGGNGSNGGGGGGAIVIASSKDITVTGTIKAQGGTGTATAPVGGHGAGGTVRLMADRILAAGGTINAAGGAGTVNQGVVRLEGFTRDLTGATITGSMTQSVPAEGTVVSQAAGRLLIKTVDGLSIAAHPTNSSVNPDVVFSKVDPDPTTITVEGINIPNGTAVTLAIKHSNGTTYNLPENGTVTLVNGIATFSKILPPGNGSIQASATYTVGQNPPAP